jgi:hypothetical protein
MAVRSNAGATTAPPCSGNLDVDGYCQNRIDGYRDDDQHCAATTVVNLMIVLVISGYPYALESVPVNLCLSALAARSGWAYGEKNGEQTDLNWGTPWMRTNCL